MEYIGEIIWYFSLPITVWVAYRFVLFNIKKFDKNLKDG